MIDDFNMKTVGPYEDQDLSIVFKDNDGRIIAGVLGKIYWKWLYIRSFWVVDGSRGKGVGTHLLSQVEAEAAKRGCDYAHLDTHDFRGLNFYLKNGYEIAGSLENLPEGFTRYQLKKRL